MMRYAMLLCIILLQSFVTSNHAQNARVTLDTKTKTVKDVLNEIESHTKYYFTYDENSIDTHREVQINAKNKKVSDILDELFESEPISYEMKDEYIVLYKSKSDENKNQSTPNPIKIKGVITDNTGEAIIGATVVDKEDPQSATISDVNGNFSLSVSPKSTIVISYLGFKKQEVLVNGKTNFDIVMIDDTQMLDELVVVGYGTQKKGNLTAAISTIKSEDIMKGTNPSLAQQLQGKIPGLQIRHQSGEPGSFNSTIKIRGFGDAIFVIDGIKRDNASEFQQLNPNDIENITVLKDASAAVYGLNAQNGVILVTTKKGITGAPKFSYSGVVGWQSPTNRPKMSSAAQYLELDNERKFYTNGQYAITEEELNKWREGGAGYESTDWYKETMKKSAMQQSHNFSVRGGNDIVDYFVSFGYLNDEGLFKSNDMKYNRYNLRSNLTLKLSKHLKADINLSGRYGKRDFPGADGFMWTYKGTIISMPFDKPYINNDMNYPANIRNQENPVLMSQKKYAGYTQDKNKVFQSSASLAYDMPFLEGMQAKATIAYDSYNVYNKNLWKSYRIYDKDLNYSMRGMPRIKNRSEDEDRLITQLQLSYNKTFLVDHNVSGTAVFETNSLRRKYMEAYREYDVYTNDVIDFATGRRDNNGGEDDQSMMSYVGRFNYDFRSKYLVEFAFRYDGSYRYASKDRWAFFPTVSGGWRISEESFIKNNFKFIDNLKVRGSYGNIGETAGAAFQFMPGYSVAMNQGAEFIDGQLVGGFAAPGVINPNLTWVKSKIFDIGVDLSVLNNLITFELDYYQRDKTGKLKRREGGTGLPNTFGGSMPEENLESERTRGFDFMISHRNKIDKVSYGVSFNLNLARTMHRHVDKPDARSSFDRWRNGYINRWNDMEWGYNKLGQFQNFENIYTGIVHGDGSRGNTQLLPGDYIFEDVNGDGIIDGKDLQPIFRNREPKLFYGFTLDAAWNNFDINAVFQGAALYTVRFDEVFSQMFFNDGNLPAYFNDRSRPENIFDPSNENWIIGRWAPARNADMMQSSYRPSNMLYMNAAFLRMKNLEIGYTLPKKLTQKYYMNNVRFYVSATNLLTFTDSFLKQFDPEKYEGSQYKGGYDYPLTKSLNIGVNVSF